jgi:precorrin-6B methylase 1
MATQKGSLLIVGTGIQAAGQVTVEARAAIEGADKLFYVVADPTTEHYLRKLNASAESLHGLYETDKERLVTYMEMVSRMIDEVRKGSKVCVAFYGHPGVFTFPSHEAIRQARALGYPARMLPGISAEDCLFADLGIDPAMAGCQSFEATDFLIFRRRFDTNSSLVLWQVGVIGDPTFQGGGYDLSGLHVLADYLIGFYGGQHRAVLYEASHYPTYEPMIQPVALADLADAKATAITTVYVPPKEASILDSEMLELLGLDSDVIHKFTITLGSQVAVPPRSDNSMATRKNPASDAAKILSDPKSTKKQKEVAGSDLAQRKPKKQADNG